MVFLTAAVVVVGLAVAVDLLLTVGVIRRLRQHTALLNETAGPRTLLPPKAGDPIGAFEAVTLDGQAVSRETLPPGGLVLFLGPGCVGCEKQLPALVEELRASGRPQAATLAIIPAEPEKAAHMISALESLAMVVCEPPPSTYLQDAFGVWSSPWAIAVDGDTITAISANLPQLVASARPPVAVGS